MLIDRGIEIWHRIVVLRDLQLRRKAWLDANDGADGIDERWAAYRRAERLVEALEYEWRRIALAARMQALRLGDDGVQEVLALGLDFRHTRGDSDDALRSQWSPIVNNIPSEPCPF